MARSKPRRLTLRSTALTGMMIVLASCTVVPRPREVSTPVPPTRPPVERPTPTPVPPAEPANAVSAGVRAGPDFRTLGVAPANASAALSAFRTSCPDLVRRDDASGLTRPEDWTAACAAAANWSDADATGFFTTWLQPTVVGPGAAFATGYYEPEIAGSRFRASGYAVPIYAKPADLLETNPLTGERGRGRLDENGDYVLYHDRGAIEEGAIAGRGLEIAWAADAVDLFFLQIQGSGRLRLSDGGVMRIGYAGQNGREYIAIGRLMRDRGLIEPPVTMAKIRAWLHDHPDEGRDLMRENRSYIFFHELTGPGPLGALGRPVRPRVSVAADPRFVPLGAPVVLAGMDQAVASGLWVAQDTGGAIRGANRFDTFWGAGAEAAAIAGNMQSRGRAYLLLPRASVARLNLARADDPTAQR